MKILFIGNENESLGIEYLSAVLKKAGHHTSMAMDPRLFNTEILSITHLSKVFDFEHRIIKKIEVIEPDLICFSVCSDNLKWALNLSGAIKENCATPIIFGGIHPTIIPEETIKYPQVDYVCEGEGEEAILELAEALQRGKDITTIANIWSKNEGAIYANPPRRLISDLDRLPFPDKEIYNKIYPAFMTSYKIVTSRGCAHSCSYCANHQIQKIYKGKGDFYRKRSVKNVIEELRIAKEKYLIKMVKFLDDLFTQDKGWLEEFSALYRNEIALPYSCFTHPDNCDSDVIRLLRFGGCVGVFMGYGTFSEETRSGVLKRYYSNQKIKDLIGQFKDTGIYLMIDCILGIPSQNDSELIQMADFFNENRPDLLSVLFLRYYPKTDITFFAHNIGLLKDKDISLINNAAFKERIIIEKSLYGKLKKMQCLMLFAKYFPKPIIRKLIKIKFFNILPALDWNNFSVALESILPRRSNKTRMNAGSSFFQYLSFYGYHINIMIKEKIRLFSAFLRKQAMDPLKKRILIYKLGLRKKSFKKIILIMRYIYKIKLLKKDIPGAVIIGLTYKCQCKCVHCSVGYPSGSLSEQKSEMAVSRIRALLEEVARLGVPKVNFFGGEPLLLGTDLIDLVQHAYYMGLNISIDTNGILLTEDFVKRLNKAGVNNINVSIDSVDSKVHDELRGYQGTFDKALNAIKLCVKEKIPCVISTYASKRSIYSGDLKKIIKIGKQLRVTAVKILFPLMSGRWRNNTGELLNAREKKIVYDLLEPGFVYLESPLFSLKNGKKVCEALDKRMFYVSPYGDVQICLTVPFSMGNIQNEPLEKIMNRMWSSEIFNSTDNNHDCIMNSPVFRKKLSEVMEESDKGKDAQRVREENKIFAE